MPRSDQLQQKKDAGPTGPPVVQVVAVEARRQPVAETLSLVGSVAAKEMVDIKSETDGVVQEIRFQEGQRMEKGQLLVQLDESKLAATLAEAEANFKLSRANGERAQQLYKDKLISQQEFDQAAATFSMTQASLDLKKRELKDTRIYAPFSGVVGARYVSPRPGDQQEHHADLPDRFRSGCRGVQRAGAFPESIAR